HVEDGAGILRFDQHDRLLLGETNAKLEQHVWVGVRQGGNDEFGVEQLDDDGGVDDVAIFPPRGDHAEPGSISRWGDHTLQNLVEEAGGPDVLTLFAEGHDDEGRLVELALRLPEHTDVDCLGAAVRGWAGHALETGLDAEVLAVGLEDIHE